LGIALLFVLLAAIECQTTPRPHYLSAPQKSIFKEAQGRGSVILNFVCFTTFIMETGMIKTTHIHLALLSLLAWYLYVCVKQWRFKKYGHIPHAFPNTLAFGHIKLVAGGYREFGDTRRHIGMFLITFFDALSLSVSRLCFREVIRVRRAP
jgi:hypothetical protein